MSFPFMTPFKKDISPAISEIKACLECGDPIKGRAVSREKLMRKGFDFGYFTSTYKTKDGAIYYYCYEQGYLPIEKEYYLLVVKQEF